jgi:hypothetical protein
MHMRANGIWMEMGMYRYTHVVRMHARAFQTKNTYMWYVQIYTSGAVAYRWEWVCIGIHIWHAQMYKCTQHAAHV